MKPLTAVWTAENLKTEHVKINQWGKTFHMEEDGQSVSLKFHITVTFFFLPCQNRQFLLFLYDIELSH